MRSPRTAIAGSPISASLPGLNPVGAYHYDITFCGRGSGGNARSRPGRTGPTGISSLRTGLPGEGTDARELRDHPGDRRRAAGGPHSRHARRRQPDLAAAGGTGRAARRFLASRGIGADNRVAIALYNGPEYLETLFAALKLRAVPVNVNYRYQAGEMAHVLADANAAAIVFDAALGARVDRAACRAVGAHARAGGVAAAGDHRIEHAAGAAAAPVFLTSTGSSSCALRNTTTYFFGAAGWAAGFPGWGGSCNGIGCPAGADLD